jgi:4'-phosphopantetheinyl transferase
VFGVRLDTRPSGALKVLSADERERAALFRLEADRSRFASRRAILRWLLGHYTRTPPEQIHFVYGSGGKPALAPEYGDVHFSVSRRGNFALYAFAVGRQVGIDLESTRRSEADLHAIASRYFSAGERRFLDRMTGPDWVTAFFRCWTRKEAYLKATGEGLRRLLNSVAVPLTAIDGEEVVEMPSGENGSIWAVSDVLTCGHFQAAVAAAGADWRVRRCQLQATSLDVLSP